MPAALLEVRAGDAGGVLLRGKVVGLADFGPILALFHGSGIANLHRQHVGRQGHCEQQCRQDRQPHGFHIVSSFLLVFLIFKVIC